MEPQGSRSIESLVAETRADVRHLQKDLGDLRHELRADVRRLDGRVFQLLLVQLATLATALGSLVAALVAALGA